MGRGRIPQHAPPGYDWCAGRSISEMMGSFEPRFVLKGPRYWMEAYCSLDEGELQHRTASVVDHGEGFGLWMGVLALHHAALTHPYSFSAASREEYASAVFRLDLLGLAGGNVKLALDAALAGYYSGSMALLRHLLETWRRSAYARLRHRDIWRWVPRSAWPKDVLPASNTLSVEQGGMPTSNPSAKQIAELINDLGDDADRNFVVMVRNGFDYLSDHSHPSLIGARQMWDPNDPLRRYFGPTYTEPLAVMTLRWGLRAGVALLSEVQRLAPQGHDWDDHFKMLNREIARWDQVYDSTEGDEKRNGAEAPHSGQ